jgi:hypothetical protein
MSLSLYALQFPSRYFNRIAGQQKLLVQISKTVRNMGISTCRPACRIAALNTNWRQLEQKHTIFECHEFGTQWIPLLAK